MLVGTWALILGRGSSSLGLCRGSRFCSQVIRIAWLDFLLANLNIRESFLCSNTCTNAEPFYKRMEAFVVGARRDVWAELWWEVWADTTSAHSYHLLQRGGLGWFWDLSLKYILPKNTSGKSIILITSLPFSLQEPDRTEHLFDTIIIPGKQNALTWTQGSLKPGMYFFF